MHSAWRAWGLRKSVTKAALEAYETKLRRTLGPVQLTALGIGAIVGAGIFATVGTAIAGDVHHTGAGPALVLSLLLTGMACAFAALCYAEFAAMIPVSGSAYTYAYATLGELVAWIIGWDLIIEYAIGNVAVAIGWSGYFVSLLNGLGLSLPPWLTTDLRTALADPAIAGAAPRVLGVPVIFNLPAAAIVALVTALLVIGIRESAWANTVMVAIKIAIIGLFLGVGIFYVRPENWTPFAPNGWEGIATGAAIIFFSYIGFDAVSTAAEEARNPQRDMPIGIIASLVITTVLYIAIAVVLTGIIPWDRLGVPDPLAAALVYIEADWAAGLISLGAVIAMTSVLLVWQLGQPRIFFSMARDGLLPPWAAKVHPRFRTPHVTTILTGVFVAFFAGFANIGEVVELTNIGTLFAFVLVAIGILVLRWRDPAAPRPFRTPWVPAVPVLAVVACTFLMLQLPAITWRRFVYWLLAGLVLFDLYGHRRSVARAQQALPPVLLAEPARPLALAAGALALLALFVPFARAGDATATLFGLGGGVWVLLAALVGVAAGVWRGRLSSVIAGLAIAEMTAVRIFGLWQGSGDGAAADLVPAWGAWCLLAAAAALVAAGLWPERRTRAAP